MTTINIEAAVVRQALEALENARPVGNDDDITGLKRLHISAITALREALEAAGTVEPFGWVSMGQIRLTPPKRDPETYVAVYTAPPADAKLKQVAWQGLTDDEIAVEMMNAWGCASIAPQSAPKFARAIEAKLREKNGGGEYSQDTHQPRVDTHQPADAKDARIAELEKDAARMDWLEGSDEGHGFCHSGFSEYRHYARQIPGYKTVREIIDAAMKEKP